MLKGNLYLKPNVLVEPLFNQWYAWSYLIAPVTAAMYVNNWHLKIMRSFIATPQIHISAQNNPAMVGGPFIDYSLDRVDEIEALLKKTIQDNESLQKLALAIKALDEKLQVEAIGYSLKSIYQEIPEALQGYVELVYDMHHHPSIRFIEGMFYKSQYYQCSSQSIALSLINKDNRTFVLTTPRLDDAQHLKLQLPFSHEGLDKLFKMKDVPKPFSYIKNHLNITCEDEKLFSSFFTQDTPSADDKYQDNNVRIRYYGHACILIETSEVSILIDPLISYKYGNHNIPRYTFEDLPERIDYVLITHNHQDHFSLETLLQLRYKIDTIVVPKNRNGGLIDPSLKLLLKNIGFRNVVEMDEMEQINLEDGMLTALPFLGEHSDLDIYTKLAYLIFLKGHSILCVADSTNLQPKLYEHLHNMIGELDILFIGMECEGAPLTWLYGPLLTKLIPRKMDQSRRLDGSNFEQAINIVDLLKPQYIYIYAMGAEPWLTHLTTVSYTETSKPIVESKKFIEECNNRGLFCEMLYGQKQITLPV